MIKTTKHSYRGMNQDISKSKLPHEYFYEGRNIRIVATNKQSTGSITNEKGNSLIVTIPIPVINNFEKSITYGSSILNYTTDELDNISTSGSQIIIGHSCNRDAVTIFTTDDNGVDCIWSMTYDTYELTLLYLRNLNFSTSRNISTVNNFENENIDKVYWIDGGSQMRFINTKHSIQNKDLEELIDLPVNALEMVGKYKLTQPIIKEVITGGSHTAGMIQYAYNLYRINSSQTKLSPFSNLISLDKGSLGGGALNEVVGGIPIIDINSIDENFTHIRVYAIKYTSFNVTPTISLIDEREIPSSGDIEIFDDGSIISTISLEEFILLGSDILIPRNIASKDSRLFYAGYREVNFDVNIDTKAYSFNNLGISTVWDNLSLIGDTIVGDPITISVDADYNNPVLEKFDAINLDYTTFKYQKDSVTLGGEGKYLKYQLTKATTKNEDSKFFKDEEIYRLGIQFYNDYGQISLPKWIADFKAPEGNLRNLFNTLRVELKSDFYVWLNNNANFPTAFDKPIGFKILIAERTLNDRTIVANGLLSPMMVNNKTTEKSDDYDYKKGVAATLPKLPNFWMRNLSTNSLTTTNVMPIRNAGHLARLDTDGDDSSEVIRDGDAATASFYQFNPMIQLFSPEISFENRASFSAGLRLRIKGALNNNYNASWLAEYSLEDFGNITEAKIFNGISPHYTGEIEPIRGFPLNLVDRGLVAHPGGELANVQSLNQFYRSYGTLGDLIPVINPTTVDIYGTPEFAARGQDYRSYNNDSSYRYTNSLESILTDGDSRDWDQEGTCSRRITSMNSWASPNVTFVTGDDNIAQPHWERPSLESIFLSTGITGNNYGMLGELVKTDKEIYLGNIYGGNSYEDKRRSNYIEIGEYQLVSTPVINILSPGDTFVNTFKFERVMRTDTNVGSQCVSQMTEIVEFLTETTIDLKNRNDLSLQQWDTKFQPTYETFHAYNKVYSQNPNLILRRDLNFNFKRVSNFDTNIIASKEKSPGEIVDSWTDIQPNEVLTMDGKYGSINAVIGFRDELYAIQEKAIALLSINPRVQVQGTDGFDIELGKGSVLNEYKYATTDSGTLNKFSVVTSPKGIYYYDTLNKSFCQFKGGVEGISDVKGLHVYFINNMDNSMLTMDNPVLKQGVTAAFDYINNDLFMTFHQGDKSFTVSYNESTESFVSFYDYIPSRFISKGDNFLATDPTNRLIYKQYAGNYNEFFGVKYPSYVTLMVNPEADQDCIFNNLEYKSEVMINSVDQPASTLTSVRLWNEYQDSGTVPLIINSNLSRKFRDWRITLPRQASSRDRIRNPWTYLKLDFNNPDNKSLVLHDVIVYYTI